MKPKGKPIKWTPEVAYAIGLLTTLKNKAEVMKLVNMHGSEPCAL